MRKALLLLLVIFGFGCLGNSKSIISEGQEETDTEIEKRQHLSYGSTPFSKRSFPQLAERQHWSYGFSPGGKREEIPAAVEKRQHWSYGFGPGGKREFMDMSYMPELSELQKRQHWSYGFGPGGKREFDASKRTAWPEDVPLDLNEEEKRQIWSYGWAPGGKRDVMPEYFLRQLLIAKALDRQQE